MLRPDSWRAAIGRFFLVILRCSNLVTTNFKSKVGIKMIRLASLLSVAVLAGCATAAQTEAPNERYKFSFEAADDSGVFLSSYLPPNYEQGQGYFQSAFVSNVAGLENGMNYIIVGIEPHYGNENLELSINFDVCEGYNSHDFDISCVKKIDSYEESVSYRYDSLPAKDTLSNGIKLTVQEI
ncbi:hypothetical protein [Vreelandella populi]|uniref:Uncharacterized protein n=1 Tax=Vreelandella populi TaxID=2498858 RepID=A0A433L7R0_9GAMM|nr:hypothetical protein [Halomonas populi]RUR43385.1 hypothetical protein ELY37_16845 [Halomonas populi]